LKYPVTDDLQLLTVLSLIATFHNHPGVIRDMVKALEPRVTKKRRAMLIAIRKNKDPKARILLGLSTYQTPPEDLPNGHLETPDPVASDEPCLDTSRPATVGTPTRAAPRRDSRTGRWVRAGSTECD